MVHLMNDVHVSMLRKETVVRLVSAKRKRKLQKKGIICYWSVVHDSWVWDMPAKSKSHANISDWMSLLEPLVNNVVDQMSKQAQRDRANDPDIINGDFVHVAIRELPTSKGEQ